jgi:uncharacterized protein
VIVVDANLLIYSYDARAVDHQKSAAWLEGAFSGTETAGLPWSCICAFVRVVTNRRLPGLRVAPHAALGAVDEWLHSPNVQILTPTERHWSVFRRMVVEGQATGPLVTDAEIAALTIEYGGVLYTADRDFARFPGLRWVNPLA